MINIGFTGTRRGMTSFQMSKLEEILHTLTAKQAVSFFHHGDCLGADIEAARIADKVFGMQIVVHPPLNETRRGYYPYDECRRPLPYLDRNKEIVKATSILIAAPSGKEVLRSGTWSTVRYAKKFGRRIIFLVGSQ